VLESSENPGTVHTQAKANHDLLAADFTKHSSLLINNVKGKTGEEDY
jgi:hypothetical protein